MCIFLGKHQWSQGPLSCLSVDNWQSHLSWQDLAHWPSELCSLCSWEVSSINGTVSSPIWHLCHCCFSDLPTTLSHTCFVVTEPWHSSHRGPVEVAALLPSYYLVPSARSPKVAPPENTTNGRWENPGKIRPQNYCGDSLPKPQARAWSLLSVCLTETKKEDSRLMVSIFASRKICPSPSVPGWCVREEWDRSQLPHPSSLPLEAQVHMEAIQKAEFAKGAGGQLYGLLKTAEKEGKYLVFLWLFASSICLLAPGFTRKAILNLGHDIEMFSRNWAACRNHSDENLQYPLAFHLSVRTSAAPNLLFYLAQGLPGASEPQLFQLFSSMAWPWTHRLALLYLVSQQ